MSNFTNDMHDLLDSVKTERDPKKWKESRIKKARARGLYGRLHRNVGDKDGKSIPFRRPE